MDTQLLCTFTNANELGETLSDIEKHYDVAFSRIFVLENEDNINELFCTYNIDREGENTQLQDTISVHRKRDTNTIFTINALNELIRELNDGELDKSYSIPWDDYDNRILLTSYGDLKQVHTNLHHIHETNEERSGDED